MKVRSQSNKHVFANTFKENLQMIPVEKVCALIRGINSKAKKLIPTPSRLTDGLLMTDVQWLRVNDRHKGLLLCDGHFTNPTH